jgi:DNA polymerase-3 subunit chi
MTNALFYELTQTTISKFLPQLLHKIWESEKNNVLVICQNDAQIAELDRLIWTFSSDKFIPHGTKNDADADKQPIFLTNKDNIENPNNAKTLISLTAEFDINYAKPFDKFIYAFENQCGFEVKELANDFTLKYWLQDDGKWVAKK